MDKIKPYDALRTKEDVQLQARTEKEQANDTFILAATFFFPNTLFFPRRTLVSCFFWNNF